MDFDPSSIPVPSTPNPPPPPGSSDAWANAAAALQRVQPAPPVPSAPTPSFPSPAQPFPWLMQQYTNGLVNAATNDYYSQQQQTPYNGQWPSQQQNGGWNTNAQNAHLKNQFNQQRQQWNQQTAWQKQQQGQQWNPNGQQQQRPGNNNFKGFGFKQPMGGRLPHLQNSFVKQGGGPMMDAAEQVCEKAPQFGQVPDSVRSYMERSLAAAPPSDHEKVLAYLEARLRPMLASGTHKFIKWESEPLPHTKNYEINKAWTPIAKNVPKANPLASPEKKPLWAPPPRGAENRRRRRTSSSSSPSESGRSSEKRGWYEDREARSPSVEITGETKYLSKKEKQRLLQKEKPQKKEKAKKNKEKKNLHFEYADPHENSRKQDRMRRFAQDVIVAAPAVPYRISRNHIVVGTSTEVEKKYFRLTAAPDPATVRPLHILKKSLEFMKQKYKDSCDYRYMCDQFRSIRQDLTVQRIRDSFTVEVYEIHARIALENKDREEFNKCQSQLKVLYEEVENCANAPEFTAYRLLYSIAMANSKDVTTILRSLTPAMREEKCVAYALKVRNKLTMGDQVGFFKLYESKAPLMCAYLLDMFVERERIAALNTFVKAYRPSLQCSLVAKWLAMDEDEFVDWMKEKKFAILRIGGELDCKTLSAVTFADA